jgi:predicted GNAT family acetyltransferase
VVLVVRTHTKATISSHNNVVVASESCLNPKVARMMLCRHSGPAEFLKHALAFLEKREAENNLLLGISSWLATHPEPGSKTPYFATVEKNGNVQAAALMTPPHNLVLSHAKKGCLVAIAEHLSSEALVLPGVVGPAETSRTFAEIWAEKTGGTFQLHKPLRIYQLSQVTPPPRADGRMRLASENDTHTLVRWIRDFSVEEPQSRDEASESLQRLLTDHRLYVWEDRELCSMAAWSGPTTHGVRINFVYTPPELRGRGYASACVAALSRSMLDSGKTFCYLFTDLSNPSANKIYQRIGYRPVSDFAEYRSQA